ncbi:MAG TPA: tetratricopeptide repeat protein, partial [Candidatus Ozemobacteraceae bacterium]|nr:tetratricopeptide repeat protein [Candidatus Ozemobacteraceae bacterium]
MQSCIGRLSQFALACLCIWGVQVAEAQDYDQFKSFARRDGTVDDILKGPQNRPRAETYYLIALSQARKDKVRDALTTIERGLSLEPGNTRLMSLRAALWARTGRTMDAIAEFERVLAIQPDDKYARESLLQLVPSPRPTRMPTLPANVPDAPVRVDRPSASGTQALPDRPEPAKVLEAKYFTAMKLKQRCFFQLSALRRALGTGNKSASGTLDLKALVAGGKLPSEPVCPENGVYSLKGDEPVCSSHGPLSQVEVEVNALYTDFNRGMTAKTRGNLTEARQAFDQVVILYPRWSEAYYQLADTLFRMGEETLALEKIKTC